MGSATGNGGGAGIGAGTGGAWAAGALGAEGANKDPATDDIIGAMAEIIGNAAPIYCTFIICLIKTLSDSVYFK